MLGNNTLMVGLSSFPFEKAIQAVFCGNNHFRNFNEKQFLELLTLKLSLLIANITVIKAHC